MMTLRNFPETTPAKSHFYSSTPLASFEALFSNCPNLKFKRSQKIFAGLEANSHLFRLEKGVVRIVWFSHGREMLDDFCLPGDLLNPGIVMHQPIPDVVALAASHDTVLRSLPLHKVEEALSAYPNLYQELIRQVLDGQDRRRQRLFRLSQLSAEDRIIHVLLEMVRRCGRPVGLEFVIKPMLTHHEMGEIAGTGRQTVTTVLNKLRRRGLVHFNRQYLLVRNLDELKACL